MALSMSKALLFLHINVKYICADAKYHNRMQCILMHMRCILMRMPYILMHIKGTPKNMQVDPRYTKPVTQEVTEFLSAKVDELCAKGVSDIIIDPGFGFGKTVEDNYQLISDLRRFRVFRRPILVGISRKSMIYKVLVIVKE